MENDNLLFPELSYKIVGVLFDVYNELGYGYQEKHYQRAVAKKLEEVKINFTEQLKSDITIGDEKIGSYFLDFLVDKKVVLELKVGSKLYPRDYKQVKAYLVNHNLELGILALFSLNGVSFERILNKKK